jgi:hypothetical protein
VGVVNWTETAKTTFNTPPAANGSGPTCTPVPGQGSATVYYIVVGTFAGILIPDDDFAGRSLVRVGVGETGGINGSGGLRVVLGPGTTLASLTPLTWSITSGAGFITVANSPANDGTGTFTAAGAGGPVVLTLTSTSTGKSVPYNVTVTPPTGAYQVTASQGKWHGDCSAFMRNYTYLLPKDVSFWMTQGNE